MPLHEAVSQLLSHIQAVIQATLSFSGALWLGITLTAYTFAIWLNRRVNGNPLVHPLVVTTIIVIGLLSLTGTQVKAFQYEAGLLHWLLGPATVALALPMYAQWSKVRALGWRLIVAIFAAGVVAPVLAWSCLYFTDVSVAVKMTMLAKSITTPLAMEASRLIGGIAPLAAVFVISTGIVGAIAGPVVFRLLNIHHRQAQGVALGAVAHAVGTARALKLGEEEAAMASLGLCLNGIMTAIILPLLFG